MYDCLAIFSVNSTVPEAIQYNKVVISFVCEDLGNTKLYQFHVPVSNVNNQRSTDSTPSRTVSRARKLPRARSQCSPDYSLEISECSLEERTTYSRNTYPKVQAGRRRRHLSTSDHSETSVNPNRHRNCSKEGGINSRKHRSPTIDKHGFLGSAAENTDINNSSCSDDVSEGRNSSLPPPHRNKKEKGRRSRTLSVPPGLHSILSQLTKEVLYAKPTNIASFCADVLERKISQQALVSSGAPGYYMENRHITERLPISVQTGVPQGGRRSRASIKVKSVQETQTDVHPYHTPTVVRIEEPGEILENKHLRGLDSRCASMTPDSLQSTARLDSTRTPEQLTARRGGSKSNTPEQGGGGGIRRAASKTPERVNAGRTPEVKREQADMVTQTVISADCGVSSVGRTRAAQSQLINKTTSTDPINNKILCDAQTETSSNPHIPDHFVQVVGRRNPYSNNSSANLTSDFDEEFSDADEDKQIIEIDININGVELKNINLLVSKHGVAKILNDTKNPEHAKLRRTTVPIQLGKSGSKESVNTKKDANVADKKRKDGREDSVTSDLPTSPGSSCLPSPGSSSSSRSLSPIKFNYLEKKPQLIRQNTFTESSCQTPADKKCNSDNRNGDGKVKSHTIQTQTDPAPRQKSSHVQTLPDNKSSKNSGNSKKPKTSSIQTDLTLKDLANFPAKMSASDVLPAAANAFMQTEATPVNYDIITEGFPNLSRTPCIELRFNSTQTDPNRLFSTQVQTELAAREEAEHLMTDSARFRDRTTTFVKSHSFTDEVVCRVLLEHADDSDEPPRSRSAEERNLIYDKAPKTSESDPGELARSSSVSIDGFNRAFSDNKNEEWLDMMKNPIDMSRSVNYLDLTKLGNEGETPNSEEMWVNVEDDNKFLTTDSESCSAATDKVSTMANCGGYGSNQDTSNLIRSVSETELLEFGAEISDIESSFTAKQLANFMRMEMMPIKDSLNTTEHTITGIAGTLCNIQLGVNNLCCNLNQMKAKVLSTGENDDSIFNIDDDKVEIVKNGELTGPPDQMVDSLMMKLEKILVMRDIELEHLINNLKEDNSLLRKELELYRAKDGSEGNLESKMQEVLEKMKTLSLRKSANSSTSAEEIKKSGETKRRVRKRNKSKADKERSNLNGYESSEEDLDRNKKGHVAPVKAKTPLVDSSQQTTKISQFFKETQTVQHLTKEASTITDLTSKDLVVKEDVVSTPNLVFTPSEDEPLIEEPFKPKKGVKPKKILNRSRSIDKKVPPQITNLSKNNTNKRAGSKPRKPLSKTPSMQEITDSQVIIGNGLGAEGADPSPTPDICIPDIPNLTEAKLQQAAKSVTPVVTAAAAIVEKPPKEDPPPRAATKTMQHSDSFEISFTGKSKPLTRSNSISRTPAATPVNPAKKSDASKLKPLTNTKSNIFKKTPRDAKDKDKDGHNKDAKDAKNVTIVENKPNPSLTIDSCVRSKVIEGDDFKITITSNAELQSCELSDAEGGGDSPKKKIVVTPKTPEKKEEKKKVVEKEVKKKNGKIPISKHFANPRAEIPGPEQFPVARPPASQIPTPSIASSYSMSPSYPICYDMPGYNHNIPPTPTQDYSICSNTYPISGRNTQMSMEGEVITMMIKQDRETSLYDAPSSLPDFADIRESPDGAFSYVIDGPAKSSMSNISDLKYDHEEEISIRMDREDGSRQGGKLRYSEYLIKRKVMKEMANNRKKTIDVNRGPMRPMDKLARHSNKTTPLRQNHRRNLFRTKSQSVSTENITKIENPLDQARKLIQSKRSMSTDRLPMLTPSEEERIIRIKKYEDDTERINESRKNHNLRKLCKEAKKNNIIHQNTNDDVFIYESAHKSTKAASKPATPTTLAEECQKQKEVVSGLESQSSKDSSSEATAGQDSGEENTRKSNTILKRLPSLDSFTKRLMSPQYPPLTVECFIVSRGWQIDQAQLTKALAKLDGINFARLQVTNTMNRVLENVRPHNDIVLVHIGSQEIEESCLSINNEDSIAGVAGSIATVYSKHIIMASKTFRETVFVLSLPLPRTTTGLPANNPLTFHERLRKAFNSFLHANVHEYDNIVLCNNDNLTTECGQPDSRYYSDGIHLNSSGFRKLVKNWEQVIKKMIRTPDGKVLSRRSSESSSITSSSSAGSNSSKSSVIKREPWKPY